MGTIHHICVNDVTGFFSGRVCFRLFSRRAVKACLFSGEGRAKKQIEGVTCT